MNLINDENFLKDKKEKIKESYGNINSIKSIYNKENIVSFKN